MSSPFSRILERTVRHLPGAVGAIFIDWEGEEVDSFSRSAEVDIRLIGAHWGIIYNQTRSLLEKLELGTAQEILLRFDRQQVLIQRVTDDYVAVITMSKEANLGRARHLMRRAGDQLHEEM